MDELITPEAVVLRPQIAGLGSRFIAALLDVAVSVALVVVSVAFAGQLGSGGGVVVAIFASVFTVLAYHTLLEMFWGGQTLGKRAQRIRVVGIDGQPITWSQAIIRNLLRLIDFLPSTYIVGAIAILSTARSQRLGDLAAATITVHDRKVEAPAIDVQVRSLPWSEALDVTALTADDLVLVRSFLRRRRDLEASARGRLAHDIAVRLRSKVTGIPDAAANEAIIEATAQRVRRGPAS